MVEFKLGVRGDPDVPSRDTERWCRFIDGLVQVGARTEDPDRMPAGNAPVRTIGSVRYLCDGDPDNPVIITFYDTDPPTLIAERGDKVSLMYLQPSGSGARYQGGNESFWEHQGEALITWGRDAAEMRCRKAR